LINCVTFSYDANATTRGYDTSIISLIVEKEVFTIGQTVCNTTTDKRTYSVAEIMEILDIGRNKAYELCNSDAFRIVRIGRTIRVSKSSFDMWLDNFE
jgi:excisionase family DNA binding protein